MTKQDWESRASAKRAARDALIPEDSLLKSPPGDEVLDVSDIPRSSGILSDEELKITETPSVTELVEAIASKKYSSEQVVRAFCRRAAIAQQLVCISAEGRLIADQLSHRNLLRPRHRRRQGS